jgi:signal transduction histidine kinase
MANVDQTAHEADAPGTGTTSAPRAAVVTLTGVGLLTAANIWTQAATGTSGGRLILDIVVGVASLVASVVVVWRPIAGAVGSIVLAALSPAATPAAFVGVIHVSLRRPFRVAVAIGLAGTAAHVIQGTWRLNAGISFGWWVVLIVASYAAVIGWGALAQSRRKLVVSLRDRAHHAERERDRQVAEARALERTRIAREMHDVLAHRVSLLATYAGALEYRPDAPREKLVEAAGVIRAQAHLALDDLRDVIDVLRDDDAEGTTPQPSLGDLPRLVAESRHAGMRVEFVDSAQSADAPPPVIGRTVFRVVQEGLTNARKHAPGRPVHLTLDGGPGAGLTVQVRNPAPANPVDGIDHNRGGTGLVGLAERVALADGRLTHEWDAGEFRLHAWLPWPQ